MCVLACGLLLTAFAVWLIIARADEAAAREHQRLRNRLAAYERTVREQHEHLLRLVREQEFTPDDLRRTLHDGQVLVVQFDSEGKWREK
jgi:hypothetical protein